MKTSLRRLLACAVMALCVCFLPAVAGAKTYEGALVSKGLDYDDAYGVVNGNALMQKKVGDSPEGEVSEIDLVSSSGEVLFRAGCTIGDFGLCIPNSEYRYMPAYLFATYSTLQEDSFKPDLGGMLVKDNSTGKLCFVDHQGDMAIDGADDIVVLESLERVVSACFVDSHLEIKLFDSEGILIDAQSGFFGSLNFNGLRVNGNRIDMMIDNNYKGFITVENDKIALHEEPVVNPGSNRVVYERKGHKVELNDGVLTFTLPSGQVKAIDKGFTYARIAWNNDLWNNGGTDVGICAGKGGDDAGSFYTLDGSEIFAGKQYDNVTKLANADAYLCFRNYATPNSPVGKMEYFIDSLGSAPLVSLDFDDKCIYEVVGEYIVLRRYSSEFELYPYLQKILNSRGSTLRTFRPQDRWGLSTAPFNMNQVGEFEGWILNDARYVLGQESALGGLKYGQYDKTCYLDENLKTIAQFDGQLDCYAEIEADGNPAFPLTLTNHDQWIPKVLYDADINPLMFHGKQRVIAKGAYQRDDLSYVTDGKGRYGAFDSTGKVAIPIAYESICDLGVDRDDSLILVKRDGKWYFMDVSGKQPDAPEFSDVISNVTPHAGDIIWLASNGISKGWEQADGTVQFRPYAEVARCDMAAFLYRLAGSPEFTPTDQQKSAFNDVDESTPHALEVWWLAAQGISTGWDNGDGTHSFRPYANVSRADMAAFLCRLAGEPELDGPSAPGFADVTKNTPHREAILWLASSGVSSGWENTDGSRSFRPYSEVARCDMAAFLHRMDEKGLVEKR